MCIGIRNPLFVPQLVLFPHKWFTCFLFFNVFISVDLFSAIYLTNNNIVMSSWDEAKYNGFRLHNTLFNSNITWDATCKDANQRQAEQRFHICMHHVCFHCHNMRSHQQPAGGSLIYDQCKVQDASQQMSLLLNTLHLYFVRCTQVLHRGAWNHIVRCNSTSYCRMHTLNSLIPWQHVYMLLYPDGICILYKHN